MKEEIAEQVSVAQIAEEMARPSIWFPNKAGPGVRKSVKSDYVWSAPTSREREDYPSRQTWRAAVRYLDS